MHLVIAQYMQPFHQSYRCQARRSASISWAKTRTDITEVCLIPYHAFLAPMWALGPMRSCYCNLLSRNLHTRESPSIWRQPATQVMMSSMVVYSLNKASMQCRTHCPFYYELLAHVVADTALTSHTHHGWHKLSAILYLTSWLAYWHVVFSRD